jgi:imidazole glycerol-phosphate synthase subunit HisH
VIRRVAIIDNGGANVASLEFALERLDAASLRVADPRGLKEASHVILPGVGAAGDAMRRLQSTGLADALRRTERPMLGICLGMQLLYERSEEDNAICLGRLPGCVTRLEPAPGRPVPHMGWNTVSARRESALISQNLPRDYFYFVHSYAAPVDDCTVASATYGRDFAAVVERNGCFGVQFHPERSAAPGHRLLEAFLRVG